MNVTQRLVASVLPAEALNLIDLLRDGHHSWRVAHLARLMADRHGLDQVHAAAAGALHDIGKLAVPRELLLKPGALTSGERRLVERHVDEGLAIIDALWPQVPPEVRQAVGEHHERCDGTGYPNGSRAQSRLGSVVAGVDLYDALRTDRAYRPGLSEGQVLSILTDVALPDWVVESLRHGTLVPGP